MRVHIMMGTFMDELEGLIVPQEKVSFSSWWVFYPVYGLRLTVWWLVKVMVMLYGYPYGFLSSFIYLKPKLIYIIQASGYNFH